MKLRWLIFLQSCLLAYTFFAVVADHKNRVFSELRSQEPGKGLDFFLGKKAAQHFKKNELTQVYAGLLPQGARNTGHFGVLLEFADHSFILAHKGANRYAANTTDMLLLIAQGMQQRVEILHFNNAKDLETFAATLGWRFVKVDVEQQAAVKEAFVQALDKFYVQPNQWRYSLVQENCMMFGIDLIEAGKPLYWSRSDVASVIPATAFANIVAAEPGKSL